MQRPTGRMVLFACAVALLFASAYLVGAMRQAETPSSPKVTPVSAKKPSRDAVVTTVTPTSPSTYSPQPSSASTAGAQAQGQPAAVGHLGPGAVVDPDMDIAPLRPKGVSSASYVDGYYASLTAKEWKKAAAMVPRTANKDSVRDFTAAYEGYELGSYSILMATEEASGSEVLVVQTTPSGGVWNITWRFVPTKRGMALKDLVYARPGGAGCH